MKTILTTTKFKKDASVLAKRGKNGQKLKSVVDILASGESLPPANKPHRLKGEFAGLWECHIEPDWLLIYDLDDEVITLVRSGTHSDLF